MVGVPDQKYSPPQRRAGLTLRQQEQLVPDNGTQPGYMQGLSKRQQLWLNRASRFKFANLVKTGQVGLTVSYR